VSFNSIAQNNSSSLLAASTTRGLISLFRTAEVNNENENEDTWTKEIGQLITDSTCNQISFSHVEKNLLGAACDLSLSLYNVEAMKVDHHFTNMHKASVKSLTFSPVNRLLLCSASPDKSICFYDMNDKVLVKKIRTDLPLSKVDFCADGFTVACSGQSPQGENIILIYDLRKSS